jgi:probable rRNA maturation factor
MNFLLDNEQSEYTVSTELEQLVEAVVVKTLEMEEFDPNVEVSVTFVSAQRIKELNKEYRSKDSVTDVLSFPQYTDEGFEVYEDEPIMIGDVVICLERAAQQAQDYGHSFEREVAYLMCHSVLHLLGYDHMDDEEKALMRSREELVMSAMGLEVVVDL